MNDLSSFLTAFTVALLRALEVGMLIKMVVRALACSLFFFRDLSELKAEQTRLSGIILVNCSQLNASVQLQASLTLCRPVLKDQAQQQAGQRINQKTQEMMCLHELEKKELQHR